MKRTLLSAILLAAVVVLTGCNGTIHSISVPAASPWQTFQTYLGSAYGDLTVVTVGSNLSASLALSGRNAVCTSDQGGFFAACSSPNCDSAAADCLAQAPLGATNVSFQGPTPFLYQLAVSLDRPAFTAGGVQLQSSTAGTVGAIALNVTPGSSLSVGAGFSQGLIPGPALNGDDVVDDFGHLSMGPNWPDFGSGFVCTDGTTTSCNPNVSPDNVAAACQGGTLNGDLLLFRTNAAPGPYSLTCGSVTVNLNINPAFATAGDCVSALKAQWCSGLTGQARAACTQSQIGVCQATFNIPSAHNPG